MFGIPSFVWWKISMQLSFDVLNESLIKYSSSLQLSLPPLSMAKKWAVIKFLKKGNEIYTLPDVTVREDRATIWYFEKSFGTSVADY